MKPFYKWIQKHKKTHNKTIILSLKRQQQQKKIIEIIKQSSVQISLSIGRIQIEILCNWKHTYFFYAIEAAYFFSFLFRICFEIWFDVVYP